MTEKTVIQEEIKDQGRNDKPALSLLPQVLILLGLALAIFLFIFVQNLLMPKYQRGVIEGSFSEEYYKEKVPHEVIFYGDCDVYENYSPIELYQKYGISSYIRGNAEQYMWQTYYMIKDTLRTETPKVIVISVHGLQSGTKPKEAYNRMTLDGMKWSPDKVNAINESMTDGETFLSYVFPVLRYHDRWSELTKTDWDHVFSKDQVSHNGYYMRCDVMPQGEFPPAVPLMDYSFDEKSMAYLAKSIELCQSKGIKVVLVHAPILYPVWYDEWDAQVKDLAKKYDVPYFNYIEHIDDIGLDMSKDTYDAGLHLNIYGAEKLADYIGAWLKDNCDLKDMREDPAVSAVYSDKISFYEKMRDDQLSEISNYGQLVNYGANAIE